MVMELIMIEALGHRILIRPEKLNNIEANKTKELAAAAGIALPEHVAQTLNDEAYREQASVDRGYVLQVGASAFNDFHTEPWVKVGDYVAFARFSGKLIKDVLGDNEEYVVINDEDIICRFIDKKET